MRPASPDRGGFESLSQHGDASQRAASPRATGSSPVAGTADASGVSEALRPAATAQASAAEAEAEATLRRRIAAEPGITAGGLHAVFGGTRPDFARRLSRMAQRRQAVPLERGDRWAHGGIGWYPAPDPVAVRDRQASDAWRCHVDARLARVVLSELTVWLLAATEAMAACPAACRNQIYDLCLTGAALPDAAAQAVAWQFSRAPARTFAELARIGG